MAYGFKLHIKLAPFQHISLFLKKILDMTNSLILKWKYKRKLEEEQSDQGLHCLPFGQHF